MFQVLYRLIEVIAFKINDNAMTFWQLINQMKRKCRSTIRTLESSIFRKIIDNLFEAQAAIKFYRCFDIKRGNGDLIEVHAEYYMKKNYLWLLVIVILIWGIIVISKELPSMTTSLSLLGGPVTG